MKYQDNELRQALAAEYVLGTLSGRARQRFERLLHQDAQLRQVVSDWEQRLVPLHEAIPAQHPPHEAWQKIQKRLGLGRGIERQGVLRRLWNSLALWRALAGAASLALLFAVYLQWFAPTLVVNQYIAVIQNEQQQASWLAKTDLSRRQLVIHVVNKQTLPLGKAFELWMLPDGGSAPISMGLLSPTDNKTLILSEALVTRLSKAKALAVSLEPPGGSPTGAPTGPVLYTGALQSL